MIHPEFFGVPANPFDEPGEHPEYLLFGSSLRGLTSEHIQYMMAFQDAVTHTVNPDASITRTTAFDATAPFHIETSVFLNGSGTEFDPEDGTVIYEPIHVLLGDLVLKSDTIALRWITMTREDDQEFGIAGFSDKGITLRNLSSVTLSMYSLFGPCAEVWATQNTDTKRLRKAAEPHTESIGAHVTALQRTLLRRLKRTKLAADETLRNHYSDFIN